MKPVYEVVSGSILLSKREDFFRLHRDDPDPVCLGRLLRLGGERRGEHGEGNAGDKASPIHYSIT
jgi:hypothetical protein